MDDKVITKSSRRGYSRLSLAPEDPPVSIPPIAVVDAKTVDAQRLVTVGRVPLFRATRFIQDVFADDASWDFSSGSDEIKIIEAHAARCKIKGESPMQISISVRNRLITDAMSGDYEASDALCLLIEAQLNRYGVEVEGYSLSNAAYEIYKYAWGLDFLEDIWRDPKVNGLHINSPTEIFCQIRGKNTPLHGLAFKDAEHLEKIFQRSCLHDRGGVLNRSRATAEFVRKDLSRITATSPPVSETITMCFRKHDLSMTLDDMIRFGTINELIKRVLKVLVSGRATIIITGATGTGKTTVLRRLIEFYHPSLRIVTLEGSQELYAKRVYPGRDILEFFVQEDEEKHDWAGMFRTVLRENPDVVITQELRGGGETIEAIDSATRGMQGSMVTAHFNRPNEVPPGIADLLKREGLDLPFDRLLMKCATAFNINIHMRADHTVGKVLLQSITEYIPDQVAGTVKYNDLLKWYPSHNDYFVGEWRLCNKPSQLLIDLLFENYADQEEMRCFGWL